MGDIELVVGILQEALGVPVTTEIQPDRPDRCVQVTLGTEDSDMFIRRPTVNLTVWGRTDMDARSLAESAYYALAEAAQDHPLLSHAALESCSRDEWTRDGHARYFSEIELTINR